VLGIFLNLQEPQSKFRDKSNNSTETILISLTQISSYLNVNISVQKSTNIRLKKIDLDSLLKYCFEYFSKDRNAIHDVNITYLIVVK
jgi:hypothetical protein